MSLVPSPPLQVYRVDPLIGCGNLLSFVELLVENFGKGSHPSLSLLCLDVNAFSALNASRGQEQGDTVLRWIGIVLQEETRAPVFRVGGDELACLLSGGTHAEQVALARRIFQRLNKDAEKFGLGDPAAAISVLQYTGEEVFHPADVFIQLGATILEGKRNSLKSFKVFQAYDLAPSGEQEYLHWLAYHMIDRMVALGAMLDESNRLAYTDHVTGLPNLRAAQEQLETFLSQAAISNQPVSVLLIDGDDLREYNKISYAAGDEMIQRLGSVLASNLRPGDFLARWRMGDEFLVILPGTGSSPAAAVGERLCNAIHSASQAWPIPITISVGVAGFPEQPSASALLAEAEAANKEAKEAGKNRMVRRAA